MSLLRRCPRDRPSFDLDAPLFSQTVINSLGVITGEDREASRQATKMYEAGGRKERSLADFDDLLSWHHDADGTRWAKPSLRAALEEYQAAIGAQD